MYLVPGVVLCDEDADRSGFVKRLGGVSSELWLPGELVAPFPVLWASTAVDVRAGAFHGFRPGATAFG